MLASPPSPIAIFSPFHLFQENNPPNTHPHSKKIPKFASIINPSGPDRERSEEANPRGSVYRRSQPGGMGKEKSWVEAGAGAENGKCAVIRCIGICKQVGKAAARR